MKRWAILALMTLFLSGCASVQLDEQIFAVSLSVDRLPNGNIRVAVQMPMAGASSQSEKSGGQDGGGYTMASADAEGFTEAVELMQASMQRSLNLSQLKSVAVSQALAEEPGFKKLVREMILTYQMLNTAQMVVTTGSAMELIKEQKPVVGVRLSEAILATLHHHQSLGYIPISSLADVFYSMESIYGSGRAILAATADGQKEENARMLPGSLPRTGDNKNEYVGAVLFDSDHMVGVLDGEQNRLLMLLEGEIKEMGCVFEGAPVQLRLRGAPSVAIDLSGDAPEISVGLILSMIAPDKVPDANRLARDIERRFDEITAYCQERQVEPFHYARRAAAQFLRVEDWVRYDWKSRFAKAQVRYEVRVDKTGV